MGRIDIKLFLTDVDGVLTDGKVFFFNNALYRFFDIKDGLAIELLKKAGIKSGIISGKISEQTKERFTGMGMDFYFQGVENKIMTAEKILKDSGLNWDEICYMGDDLPDIKLMKKAGLALAPSDAVREVKKTAHYVCNSKAGRGAFREAVEFILKEQKQWEEIVEKFYL